MGAPMHGRMWDLWSRNCQVNQYGRLDLFLFNLLFSKKVAEICDRITGVTHQLSFSLGSMILFAISVGQHRWYQPIYQQLSASGDVAVNQGQLTPFFVCYDFRLAILCARNALAEALHGILERSHTPNVYAIELFEFPKEIPIARFSVGATPSLSSILMMFAKS